MLENQLPEAREGVRKVIIVLTDGNSQQPDVTKAEAHKALEAGLEVFAIGVGHAVSEEELHNIASDSKHVFIVGSYQMLDDILDRLAFETCGVQPKPQCQYDPVDIAFVIDSSVSIGKENFTIGLEFIKEFLEDFEINPTAVRVAAVMFGKVVYADSAIPFDAYDDEKDTLDAILNLKWEHGTRTETGLGIDYMVDHFLPHTREHAAHIGIVITDGESQEPDKTATAAQRARDAGAIMFAVGVGKLNSHAHGTLDEAELNSIAGDPSHVLLAEDYSKLDSIREELLHITCSGITTRLEAKGNAK
ncbi:collagen alpha-6(VI) chain [Aplysia californica]|uniref:Collagen alpha-6(VI) chain n=1 Tax=Aplysia californica TaxID=6500 RepID=A0ABM0JL16_APLCA|nr:collagen alpha-6(VI) chain [Aplysia californica]